MFSIFLRNFCQTFGSFRTIIWNLKPIHHTKQIDSCNCGVFVMIFMKKINEEKDFENLKTIIFSNNINDLKNMRKDINIFFLVNSVE